MQVQSAVTKYCFNPFDAIVSFYPPWKYLKNGDFLFPRGIERDKCYQMGQI